MPTPTLIRPSTDADVPALAAIYRWNVLNGTGTFELDPPDAIEMTRRRADVLAQGWPWLVAEREGTVLGYAYAAQFRPRPAYRFYLEDSIYLGPEAQRQGLGKRLLDELLGRCTAAGARQMLAVIGDADNLGSIALHAAQGFVQVGRMPAAGWKFGRWLDVVLMQRALGAGAASAPDAR